MMAWYEDIKALTESSGPLREAFIQRTHARSFNSGTYLNRSISDASALGEDDADRTPYATNKKEPDTTQMMPKTRPSEGGRFRTQMSLQPDSHVPAPPSSSETSADRNTIQMKAPIEMPSGSRDPEQPQILVTAPNG